MRAKVHRRVVCNCGAELDHEDSDAHPHMHCVRCGNTWDVVEFHAPLHREHWGEG